MSRISILCPGRGSYTEKSLGSLPTDHEWVVAADRVRAEYGLEPLVELDGAKRFEPARHLRPAHVSALIYVRSMLDGARAIAEHEAVAIAGNSMGWYTALAMGGALSFEDGFRLVQDMALLQEEEGAGGQIIYPVVDDGWQRVAAQEQSVRELLASAPGEVFASIHLGGYEVLAGTNAGVARALKELPKVKLGKVTYPFRLAQHGPYHTPLVSEVSRRARINLTEITFARPQTTLVDGRGVRFTPWSADLAALRDYTLGAQVDTTYDFTASVRVALLEFAPDLLVTPGPGNTLGGVCGQILIDAHWRGIRTRADFDRVQASDAPILLSMDR